MGCRMVHKDLIYEILSVVEEIPEGCVATYGQIARLIDFAPKQIGNMIRTPGWWERS